MNLDWSIFNSPLVTAHTGCMNTQENSMDSVLTAVKSDADFIEVDVRSTKDHVAVLYHNSFVIDYLGNVFNIYDLSFDELKRISDGNDFHLAKLDDILDLVKEYGKKINLDLKGPFAAQPMAKLILNKDMIDEAVITGCRYELVYYLKRIYPRLSFYLNADESDFMNIEEFNKKCVRDALSAKCIGINLQYGRCNADLIKKAKENSLVISVWTVNDVDAMKNMVDMKVDSITTKNVTDLLNLLRGK